MALPPYLLPPHPWATMMAQQQAHAQMAAAAQAAAVMQTQALQSQRTTTVGSVGPAPAAPKQIETISEEKLQEKGIAFFTAGKW